MENRSLLKTCKKCGKTWNISKLQRVPKSGYICPHCRSKAQGKRRDLGKRITETALKYALIAIIGVVLYAQAAEAAEIQRGYKAYGGELFILLLPLWWIFIEKMVRETVAEVKKCIRRLKPMFEFMKGAFYFMCGVGCIYVSVVFATATVKSIKEATKGRKDGR